MASACVIALKSVVYTREWMAVLLNEHESQFYGFWTLGFLWLDVGGMPEPLRSCLSEREEESILLADTNTTAQQCIQAQEIGWFITNEYFPSLLRLHITLQELLNQFWLAPARNRHYFSWRFLHLFCKGGAGRDLNIVNCVKLSWEYYNLIGS